jgi:hypothetical protein
MFHVEHPQTQTNKQIYPTTPLSLYICPKRYSMNTSAADPSVMEAIERGNAVVFFDIALGEGAQAADVGRIKLELFVNDVRE